MRDFSKNSTNINEVQMHCCIMCVWQMLLSKANLQLVSLNTLTQRDKELEVKCLTMSAK